MQHGSNEKSDLESKATVTADFVSICLFGLYYKIVQPAAEASSIILPDQVTTIHCIHSHGIFGEVIDICCLFPLGN
jgi:hypothetical protein